MNYAKADCELRIAVGCKVGYVVAVAGVVGLDVPFVTILGRITAVGRTKMTICR